MRYGQLVVGPAGSGKSTYCGAIVKHAQTMQRTIRVCNLDPAAEQFNYDCQIDVRELVNIDDVMDAEDLRLGPNGGLMFCMQHLCENLDWLEQQLGDEDDDYWLFDCPGQIELYTHVPVMRALVDMLQQRMNFRLCAVFLLDTQFMLEVPKFFSCALVALSAMVTLELPAVNVLSKMDLLNARNRELVNEFLQPNAEALLDTVQPSTSSAEGDASSQLSQSWAHKYHALSKAIAQILDDYSLLKFTPFDVTDEESMNDVLLIVDQTIQFGEDADVRDRFPEEVEMSNGGNGLKM